MEGAFKNEKSAIQYFMNTFVKPYAPHLVKDISNPTNSELTNSLDAFSCNIKRVLWI